MSSYLMPPGIGKTSTECAIHDIVSARPEQQLEGTTISLASDWATHNYCHFLLESLPRILLEQAGFSREKCDRVLVPDLGSLTARQLRNTLDISEAKIFRLSSLGSIQCEELIVTSFPGIRRNVSGRQVASIRELVGNYRGRGQRRIYVSRGQGVRRSILNEAELVRILASHEFEVFTPGNGIQDFRVFSEASVIVGSDGAGLSEYCCLPPGNFRSGDCSLWL